MLFAVFVRANADSEASRLPDSDLLADMIAFNKTLVEARILITGEGLTPSSRGARLSFTGDPSAPTTVTPGPFPAQELVCGFWLLDVKDLDEALGWMKKCPMGKGAVLEIRPGHGAEDFGDAMTPELRKREEELRKGELLKRTD
ncbi:MAG: hypothetical protein M1840_002545 [Geoglossum simile]|nr:MAG: hypothetical protein M1840_002545 [Geoglossum simile]